MLHANAFEPKVTNSLINNIQLVKKRYEFIAVSYEFIYKFTYLFIYDCFYTFLYYHLR